MQPRLKALAALKHKGLSLVSGTFLFMVTSRLRIVNHEAKEEAASGTPTDSRLTRVIKTHTSESQGQGGSSKQRPNRLEIHTREYITGTRLSQVYYVLLFKIYGD